MIYLLIASQIGKKLLVEKCGFPTPRIVRWLNREMTCFVMLTNKSKRGKAIR